MKSGRCERSSPVFDIQPDRQRRFDKSLIVGVKRCRFNHVQVITCKPLSNKLRPFPTTFWLMCPYLARRAGTVESDGGVRELEDFIKARGLELEWRRYNFIHQAVRLSLLNRNVSRFMRKYRGKIFKTLIRGGIGGMRYDCESVNVKCLHLQTASYLGLGFHPASEWLRSKGLCGDCSIELCARRPV
ncbi:MAG: DUF501 domain-containing protein [Synergistaceae bacterium]|nr:DUF501 domain-containing protein [Synergistaceae bacterium]